MLRTTIVLAISLAVSCTSNSNKKNSEENSTITDSVKDAPAVTATTNVDGCYMQVLKRDTFAASLQQSGDLITGKMSFNNYEKDASSGNVAGRLEGDILKLNYTFMSEGMNSVMELYFKYSNGNLLRGVGDMGNKGDTAYFTKPAEIKYEADGLKKLDCQNLPAQYK